MADVHPQDFIFQFVLDHPAFTEPKSAVDYYFDDGAQSAQKLAALLAEMRESSSLPFRLLEFASEFGCVTRHLGHALPDERVTSCDIHADAVNFIKHTIGSSTLLSHEVPEKLSSPDSYDVIFALSFFSHMPRETWVRWLAALLSLLSDGGLLIFTTHGFESLPHFGNPPVNDDGFWFQANSEQNDLDTSDYGSTIMTPAFVFGETDSMRKSARIVGFQEAAGWGHQDVYVMSRL